MSGSVQKPCYDLNNLSENNSSSASIDAAAAFLHDYADTGRSPFVRPATPNSLSRVRHIAKDTADGLDKAAQAMKAIGLSTAFVAPASQLPVVVGSSLNQIAADKKLSQIGSAAIRSLGRSIHTQLNLQNINAPVAAKGKNIANINPILNTDSINLAIGCNIRRVPKSYHPI